MSTFMTAGATRDLLRRSMQPRASHITPELNARLLADTDEQIAAARGYAEAMMKQGYLASAPWGYSEVMRLEKLRRYWGGKTEEGDDESSHDTRG